MKGVPPDIDALMWQLAEDGGPVAQAEFEARYLRYAPELTRRIRMVAELREAGKTVVHRPSFTPRPTKIAPTPRWTVGAAIGLGTLAVGAVAYVLASGESQPLAVRETTKPPVTVPRIVPTPQPKESSAVQEPPPSPIPPQDPPTKMPDYLKPRDVRVTDTALTTAINLVAAGGGLKVTVAPGFEDRKVTLDYRGVTTIDTLKMMGEAYGFSVLDEEEGSVLVVPAREPQRDEHRIGT